MTIRILKESNGYKVFLNALPIMENDFNYYFNYNRTSSRSVISEVVPILSGGPQNPVPAFV